MFNMLRIVASYSEVGAVRIKDLVLSRNTKETRRGDIHVGRSTSGKHALTMFPCERGGIFIYESKTVRPFSDDLMIDVLVALYRSGVRIVTATMWLKCDEVGQFVFEVEKVYTALHNLKKARVALYFQGQEEEIARLRQEVMKQFIGLSPGEIMEIEERLKY